MLAHDDWQILLDDMEALDMIHYTTQTKEN